PASSRIALTGPPPEIDGSLHVAVLDSCDQEVAAPTCDQEVSTGPLGQGEDQKPIRLERSEQRKAGRQQFLERTLDPVDDKRRFVALAEDQRRVRALDQNHGLQQRSESLKERLVPRALAPPGTCLAGQARRLGDGGRIDAAPHLTAP